MTDLRPFRTLSSHASTASAGWTMWNDSWRNASPRVRAGQLAIVSQVIAAHIVLPH
jgi:hypothetical protein